MKASYERSGKYPENHKMEAFLPKDALLKNITNGNKQPFMKINSNKNQCRSSSNKKNNINNILNKKDKGNNNQSSDLAQM